ncbi:MAG: hypothetical protein GX824_00175 [Clostridiales bacterium]|jgi:hypothetical protein|nr:hypothetical protein [Clostridiales bacterium]
MNRNEKKGKSNGKRVDGKFRSKHINHDPNGESARAVFGLNNDKIRNKDESAE